MSEKNVPVSAADFVAAVRPAIEEAVARLGAANPGALTQALLAEAAVETGWRPDGVPTPAGEPPSYNLTGIADARGVPVRFPSLGAWALAEARALELPFYRAVVEAADPEAACRALGASPWAASHYVGDPPDDYPGGSIYAVWRDNLRGILGEGTPAAQAPPADAPAPWLPLTPGEALRVEEVDGELRVEEGPPG
jgi:hypothetical protein